MDFVGPILVMVTRLWDCGARRVAHVRNLGKSLEELEIAMNELRDLRDDAKERVETAAGRHRELVSKVEGWLEKVERTENQVVVLIHQGKLQVESKCLGCCPRNMWRTYMIAKKVVKKIQTVKGLMEDLNFEYIRERLHRHRQSTASEWAMENTVGLESMVGAVRRHIEDRSVGIIGLYGMGGVGKTTLLKKINNEFSTHSHGFDFVIWVTLTQSKAADDKEFQEIVRRKLEIPDDTWNECSNEDDRACELFRVLRGRRFVLLLDDVQNRSKSNVHFTSLGIPFPDNQNQSKIIFTTRSEELCGYMGAQVRIKVECLPPEQALSLFSKIVGENILNSNPETPRLAEIVAARCRGLPLALLTVGRAMASRKTPQEWRYAIQVLQSYPSEFSGMGDHVFPLLKFSYDSLDSPITRKCFLYCSVFPENHMISVDELIDLWIGEGLLDDRANPRDQGEFIIGTLKLSCLLDGDESTGFVWMHELIRDMALWLARDEEQNKNKVLVTRSGRFTDQEFAKWRDSSWVSLWGSTDREIICYPPRCPNLSTLLIRDALINAFPSGFFDYIGTLNVLDLSGNQGLVEFPPEIGRLTTLQYLNLSLTSITKLPPGLANLRNLKCLLLDYTMYLKEIPPREVMSCLTSLQVYSKINGVMEYFDEAKASADDELAFLEGDLRYFVAVRYKNSEYQFRIAFAASVSEEIVEDEVFPKLKTISLTRLRSLEAICRLPVCFSSLLEIEVSQCPRLRQLPFHGETADFLKRIRGETEWWEALVWDSDIVKDTCNLKFISTSGPSASGKTKEQMAFTSKEKTARVEGTVICVSELNLIWTVDGGWCISNDSLVLLVHDLLLMFFPGIDWPKALVIPLSKDASTLQYITQIKQRTPVVPVKLTLDVGGDSSWVDCENGYVSSSYKPVSCNSVACNLAYSPSCGSCFGGPKPGCNNNNCNLFPTNNIKHGATIGEVAQDAVSVQSTNGKNPGEVVSVSKFIFTCASSFLMEGLASGVKGVAGLGRTKISMSS
ncbi:hypothetical protein V6N12_029818 [Hibiscus sabdariffa]|uniref:Peptidase A1 domain-containing protein n=1 Tax=Hibiscus sabdariffa TaxID=183260 RepID=A0ABR2CXR9_9ROSI